MLDTIPNSGQCEWLTPPRRYRTLCDRKPSERGATRARSDTERHERAARDEAMAKAEALEKRIKELEAEGKVIHLLFSN
jgi:flagellar motility protein MotE (MotC chaperone)